MPSYGWIVSGLCCFGCMIPPILGFLIFRVEEGLARKHLTIKHTKQIKDGHRTDYFEVIEFEREK